MNIAIVDQAQSQYGRYFTLSVEGQQINVNVYTDGRVNVCVNNLMSQVYNRGFGHGRMFPNIDDALAGYKGPKPKAAIEFVKSQMNQQS